MCQVTLPPVLIALSVLLTALAGMVGAPGCTTGQAGWDLRALEARNASLREVSGHRLGDATPYFVPDAAGLTLFLCRWSTGAAVPVSLPPDASPEEADVIRAALAAWEGALPGMRFAEREGPAALDIRFVEAEDGPVGTGDTIADCAVPSDFAGTPGRDRIPADLAYASVHLRRSNTDDLGRPIPLSKAQLAGTVLHELGHALGFAGHVRFGSSVMGRTVEVIRRHGERLLEGERFEDPTLAALYSIPSGVAVGRVPVAPDRTAPLRRLADLAARAGWRGPYIRVSPDQGRILWRSPDDRQAALVLQDWRGARRDPDEHFDLVGNPSALALLRSVGAAH